MVSWCHDETFDMFAGLEIHIRSSFIYATARVMRFAGGHLSLQLLLHIWISAAAVFGSRVCYSNYRASAMASIRLLTHISERITEPTNQTLRQ